MTKAAEAVREEVVDGASAESPPSWVRGLLARFSPAAELVVGIIKADPVHTPGTVRPDTIGLREKWDASAKGEDFVTFVDPQGRPALFVQPGDFEKFVAGKDVAKAARGVGKFPQEAWSNLFEGLASQGSAILVVGKPGRERRYYTLEPFNDTVRWTPWTPPIDMNDRFLPAPKI